MIIDIILIPGVLMIFTPLAVPFFPKNLRGIFMLTAIALSAATLSAGHGVHLAIPLLGEQLILHRADNLTLPFGIVFHIAAALSVIYGWHESKPMEHAAGLVYAGAAIAAIHAGDLISLFIWWEATAIASLFLVMAPGTTRARAAAMRYLMVQITSGLLLLAGAAAFWHANGTWEFGQMRLDSLATWLIFIAFGIKAAFPLLNGWVQDAYPEASPLGAVMLSAFTTKLAIYALARGFAGTELLIFIGAAMAILPVFFVVIENDLRRVLAFSLNNQLGFMVVGIGIGTELALNGAVAHAFAHIIYKSLLFMAIGAVLFKNGTARGSELGGLYKSMPLTMVFCIIGAVSISALPLFSSFVAKGMITTSIGYEGFALVYLTLLAASAGVAGIKIVYFPFFHRPGRHHNGEAPPAMLAAMAIAAALCIAIGVMPQAFYSILPYEIAHTPYSAGTVIAQLQLLVFVALAFAFMIKKGLYPREMKSTVLNSDWFYRKAAPPIIMGATREMLNLASDCNRALAAIAARTVKFKRRVTAHPVAGPVIPGPAVLGQLLLLTIIIGVVYAIFG